MAGKGPYLTDQLIVDNWVDQGHQMIDLTSMVTSITRLGC
jgi:hypothetical protein